MKYCPLCSAEFSDEHSSSLHDGVQLIRSQEWAAPRIHGGRIGWAYNRDDHGGRARISGSGTARGPQG
jgi:hypothetical protein